MKIQSLVFTAFTLFPLTACVDQNEADPGAIEENEHLGVTESALCFYNSNAPVTADYSWDLNTSSPKVFQINSYGNINCRRVTVGFDNAAEAAVKINYSGVSPVWTASNCGNVTVHGRFWYFDNGAWTLVGTRTDTGTWTGFNCLLPEVSYTGSIIRDEIRVEITTEWGTSTELPVRVTGDQ